MGKIEKINKAIMFTKPNCPFCVKAKKLMDEEGITYKENVVGEDCTKAEMQSAVSVFNPPAPVNTVPQIFIYGEDENGSSNIEYIGGCDEFHQYMGK